MPNARVDRRDVVRSGMVNEGLMFLKARRSLVKSWLRSLLVCEQDKAAS